MREKDDCMELLVDYLEQMSLQLEVLRKHMQKLSREYKISYDREIRKEMDEARLAIKRKKWEIKNELFRNLPELILIKNYFPKFFDFLVADEQIGTMISGVSWLAEVKDLKPKDAEDTLAEIKEQRRKIRSAKDFCTKHQGKMDWKEVEKSWPILKAGIKGIVEKDEALRIIDEKDGKLRLEGWKVIVGSAFIILWLKKLFRKLAMARAYCAEKEKSMRQARGTGSVSEYETTKDYENALRRLSSVENTCLRLLLANPRFLATVKNGTADLGDRITTQLASTLAFKVRTRDINQIKWLGEMKKRLS